MERPHRTHSRIHHAPFTTPWPSLAPSAYHLPLTSASLEDAFQLCFPRRKRHVQNKHRPGFGPLRLPRALIVLMMLTVLIVSPACFAARNRSRPSFQGSSIAQGRQRSAVHARTLVSSRIARFFSRSPAVRVPSLQATLGGRTTWPFGGAIVALSPDGPADLAR